MKTLELLPSVQRKRVQRLDLMIKEGVWVKVLCQGHSSESRGGSVKKKCSTGQRFRGEGDASLYSAQFISWHRKQVKIRQRLDLRVLPSFVVDAIFMWTRLVFGITSSDLQDLGFVEKLVVEAEDLLIFGIGSDTCCG